MKQLLLFLSVLWAGAAFGQLIEEDTTLNEPFFKSKAFHSSGYVQAEVQPAQILKTKAAGLMGFGLNWAINHRYVIGAQYFTLVSQNDITDLVGSGYTAKKLLIHHFAGLGFSYIFFDDKKFSLQPGLTAGWCSAKYEIGEKKFLRRDYGALVPSLSGVFNASKHFRVGVGLNYRAVIGPRFFALRSTDLSGVSGVVFFRVGTF